MMKRTTALTVAWVLTGGFLLLAGMGLPFAWILKDGLGPGAVESSGWDSVVRCLKTFYIGPVLGVLGLGVVGAWVWVWSPRD